MRFFSLSQEMLMIALYIYILMIGFFKICKKIPFKACLPAGKLFKKKTLKIMTTISMNYILTQHFAIFSIFLPHILARVQEPIFWLKIVQKFAISLLNDEPLSARFLYHYCPQLGFAEVLRYLSNFPK